MVQILVALIPHILKLMMSAEAFHGAGNGEQKKEAVMTGVQEVIGATQELSKGGQKETWDEIAEPVSNIVDNACDILFGKNEG